MPRRLFPRLAALAVAAVLAGCSAWPTATDPFTNMISPYRITIQQGNVVTSEQLARVKIGMDSLQVRDVLGTPLLHDAFHADRWDYIFTLAIPGRPVQRRNVTLIFDAGRLQDIQAPELPTEQEFVASVASGPSPALLKTLELSAAQLKALPAPRPAAAASQPEAQPLAPSAPPRSYPPLEPS